jgi:hypothetical protein
MYIQVFEKVKKLFEQKSLRLRDCLTFNIAENKKAMNIDAR